MENATLNRKGKGWQITKSNGKKLTCNWSNIPEDWNGKEVLIKYEKGQPVEIEFDSKSIKKEFVTKKNKYPYREKGQRNSNNNNENTRNYVAHAPYNFIPLNEKVVEAPDLNEENLPNVTHSQFDNNRLSGYIELNIEALTPLFIRGNDNRFLLVNNQPIIPGSSLRGLIKNMVKIIGYGSFQSNDDFEDKVLYKRGTLVEMNGGNAPQPGFLCYKDGSYFIKPAFITNSTNSGAEFGYNFSNSNCVFTTGKFGNRSPREFTFKIDNKKSTPILVPKSVQKSYEEDKQRSSKAPNVFVCARLGKVKGQKFSKGLGMPVFYTLKSNTVFSISHAKYGRIPYSASIADHVPQSLKDNNNLDIATSIFGTTEFATRVYFEDALVQSTNCEMDEKQPRILSSPKPTSYQLYLEQGSNSGKGQKTWNDKSAEIRGYKMYWHRKTSDDRNSNYSWVEKNGIKTDSHPDPIKAVKPKTIFKGKIRFDNLNEIELGALLAAINLPDNCCHKLGMAKPLGLGSVKINGSLKIIDRKDRYAKLFDTDVFNTSEKDGNSKIKDYKNAFAEYVLKKLEKQAKTIDDLWKEDRLKELRKMLTWDENVVGQNDWLKKTEYMELGKFKNILPRPTKV